MKKLLLILLCLPLLFTTCKKEENCNCGDYIGVDYEAEWRTEPIYVEKCLDELWVGVKG